MKSAVPQRLLITGLKLWIKAENVMYLQVVLRSALEKGMLCN